MKYEEFINSLSNAEPPEELPPLLESLWYDAQGDWDTAHNVAQSVLTNEGSLVHAYLHRKEGDSSNALYWYHRADAKAFSGSLDDEWSELVKQFIVTT